MAKKDDKGKKKDKKGKKGADGTVAGPSVAGHPRARAQVRRAKGLGGIVFFFLTLYWSHNAGLTIDHALFRALIGGIAGYVVAWACAVGIWRHLVLAEFRAALESGRATIEPAPGPGDQPAPKGA